MEEDVTLDFMSWKEEWPCLFKEKAWMKNEDGKCVGQHSYSKGCFPVIYCTYIDNYCIAKLGPEKCDFKGKYDKA